MVPPVIIERLTFCYARGAAPALHELSVSIPAGTCCAVLGPTGSGKSTLFGILSGVLGAHHKDHEAHGQMTIGTSEYSPIPMAIQFPRVGLMTHDPGVQITGVRATVAEEIRFALDSLHTDTAESERKIGKVLRRLDLVDLAARDPATLSGGELQRVVLAGVLVAEPSLLLLDEPAHSIDAPSLARIAALLRNLKATTTVLFSDVQLELALMAADHFIVLREGELVFSGPRRTFLQKISAFRDILPAEEYLEIRDAYITHPFSTTALGRYFGKELSSYDAQR